MSRRPEQVIQSLEVMIQKFAYKIRRADDLEARRDLEYEMNVLKDIQTLLSSKYEKIACTECYENKRLFNEEQALRFLDKANYENALRQAKTNVSKQAEMMIAPTDTPRIKEEHFDKARWQSVLLSSPDHNQRVIKVITDVVGMYYGITNEAIYQSVGRTPETDARHLAICLLTYFKEEDAATTYRWMVSNGKSPLNKYALGSIQARLEREWNAVLGEIRRVIGHDLDTLSNEDLEKLEVENARS